MEMERIKKLKEPIADEGEVVKTSSIRQQISKGCKIENLLNKFRALVGIALLLGVLYIIVYNMFVPHSDKKEIPQEVIQTLLKIAAGSGAQLSPITDHNPRDQFSSPLTDHLTNLTKFE